MSRLPKRQARDLAGKIVLVGNGPPRAVTKSSMRYRYQRERHRASEDPNPSMAPSQVMPNTAFGEIYRSAAPMRTYLSSSRSSWMQLIARSAGYTRGQVGADVWFWRMTCRWPCGGGMTGKSQFQLYPTGIRNPGQALPTNAPLMTLPPSRIVSR